MSHPLVVTLDKRSALANDIIKGVILPQFVILPLAILLVWFGLRSKMVEPLFCSARKRSDSQTQTSATVIGL